MRKSMKWGGGLLAGLALAGTVAATTTGTASAHASVVNIGVPGEIPAFWVDLDGDGANEIEATGARNAKISAGGSLTFVPVFTVIPGANANCAADARANYRVEWGGVGSGSLTINFSWEETTAAGGTVQRSKGLDIGAGGQLQNRAFAFCIR